LFASALIDRISDFTWVESFSVSFSVLGLLPSIASTLGYNLGYSGQAGSIWGWIVAGILIQSVVFGMAELCSSMPTAGGLYYASAVLAPEGWGPLVSWVSLTLHKNHRITRFKLTVT
jgi:amino acid transporter